MNAENVSVIYDRKHTADAEGTATVEIRVYLGNGVRKYLTIGESTPRKWKKLAKSVDVVKKVRKLQNILITMDTLGEPKTKENFEKHLKELEKPDSDNYQPVNMFNGVDQNQSFVEFVLNSIDGERLAKGTLKNKMVMLDAVKSFGHLERFCDLTPANLIAFDKWLRKEVGKRQDCTIWNNYHKKLHMYIRKLYVFGMIPADPYLRTKFPHGKCKERRPLTERELVQMRELKLFDKTEKVRDLFIFSAYTGLAYCDVMAFDFQTMTVKVGDLYFIDGSRIKTGSDYFTPILSPAMAVLKKYNFKLPRISNEKANEYLHLIQARMEMRKNLTFHVARHSFATLALSYDIPIADISKMLGHRDIKVTQIYAKVMKTSLERHSNDLNSKIR